VPEEGVLKGVESCDDALSAIAEDIQDGSEVARAALVDVVCKGSAVGGEANRSCTTVFWAGLALDLSELLHSCTQPRDVGAVDIEGLRELGDGHWFMCLPECE